MECYAGYRGDEEPRALFVAGRRVEVAAILDRAASPTGRIFRVRGSDGSVCRLTCREPEGEWEMSEERPCSLEEALRRRRSGREFGPDPLTAGEILRLCWAAQGVTHPEGFRTAPSAGATYPLELHVATAEGIARYEPAGNRLQPRLARDFRPAVRRAALGTEEVTAAPALFVIAAVVARTARRYGAERSPRYVHFEVGHAAQNLLLEAAALGLAAVPIAAFDDDGVREALALPRGEEPLYLIPVGRPPA